MDNADSVAEQNQTLEGYRLADYRAVALPYYIIYVDAVVLERRPLTAVTEFIFRAILTGLTVPADVCAFLGVEGRFFNRLVSDLCDERYISLDLEGKLQLLARGEQVLANCYEAIPQERELPIVWDLLKKRPAGYLETLIRETEAKRDGLLLVRAKPMRPPTVSEIPLQAVQATWATRSRAPVDEHSEVIRVREAKRRLLRYRPAVGLVYLAEKGSAVRVRFAVGGKVDDGISQGFAEQDGPGHMGIATEFAKKATTLSIRTRLKELPGNVLSVSDYGSLLKKRAVARLGLEGLQRRLEEEHTDELVKRLSEKQSELAGIDDQIKALPLRELMPYEVIQLTREALLRAEKRIMITTRVPSRERLTNQLLNDIKNAARRGVKVSIFLAGKVPSDDEKHWNAVRELDRLVNSVPGIEVAFLLELKRSIFELSVDEELIVFCNRPPLGDASTSGLGFHPFAGFAVSDKLAVRAYAAQHLSPGALQITQRIQTRLKAKRKDDRSSSLHQRPEQLRRLRRPKGERP